MSQLWQKVAITHQDILKALTETGFQTKLEKTMIRIPLRPQFFIVTFFLYEALHKRQKCYANIIHLFMSDALN